MSLLHKLSRPFVEYLWYCISFKCLLFLLLTHCVLQTSSEYHRNRKLESWLSWIPSSGSKHNEWHQTCWEGKWDRLWVAGIWCWKLIVSRFKWKIIFWSIIHNTWIPKIYVWSFLETLDWFFIGFPIDWINSGCTFDFKVSRLCEQILFNF